MPERLVGPVEQQVDPRPLDLAVEHHSQRPVFRLPPAAVDVEGAVAAALAAARQPELGRIELQVGEMEDAVGAALQVGLDPRQAAGEAGEEAVVEPPDPGLGRADDARALAAGPGTTRRSVMTSTMPRPGMR